ncbi:uncharacterized protein [Arachis hypogaea]|uniref:uncharacterized protein n=1 Tax=Arachis hypogaea TaxID=3818 RepID=UPI003B21A123|nr:uncharacterized protein DS421_3g71400 [Arachis hypogaea]
MLEKSHYPRFKVLTRQTSLIARSLLENSLGPSLNLVLSRKRSPVSFVRVKNLELYCVSKFSRCSNKPIFTLAEHKIRWVKRYSIVYMIKRICLVIFFDVILILIFAQQKLVEMRCSPYYISNLFTHLELHNEYAKLAKIETIGFDFLRRYRYGM